MVETFGVTRFGSFGLLLLVLASCGHGRRGESALARVQRTGVLRWGGDLQGGEPYVYEDPAHAGHLIGFEVEIMEAVAHAMGARQQFVQNDWSNLVPSLDRGTFDVAFNGLEVTPGRAGAVRFTRPYYIFSEQLVVRRDTHDIHGLADVGNRRVGTLASSMGWDMLQSTGAVVVPYEGVEEPYEDLQHRRIDAVLLDDVIAARYGLPKPDLRLASDVADGYYAAAVQRDEPELQRALDDALARVTRSGELRRILGRWHLDGEREERLLRWSAADTRAMLGVQTEAHVTWGQALLFVKGAGVTIVISAIAMSLAIALGLVIALVRRFAPRPLRVLATFYVEIFRGTPVLLQLYVIYFGLSNVSDALRLGPIQAAILGLGLNYAAYESEIYRAGMEAVPPGQMEAAHALGMGTLLALRRILVPQATRIALPGMTNDFISLLKDSSLVSVITVVELTKRMTITAVDVRSWLIPGLLCAGLYLAMSWPLSRLSGYLEKRLAGADS